MKFIEDVFEQLRPGETCNTTFTPYKEPTGKDIGDKVKDLGVIKNQRLEFKVHIEKQKMYWQDSL